MLTSESIPKKFLNKIYRTNDNSYINILADKIKNKEKITEVTDYDDFKFIKSSDEDIVGYLKVICKRIKDKKISLDDFQVLVPMYAGNNGIDNLNLIMQEVFNPYDDMKRELTLSNIIYRESDKVIQLVNDVDNNVYNGDIGYIEKITSYPKKTIEVNFSGNKVTYEQDSFQNVSLAYAISIHKSQGSEYDNVVVILSKSQKRMFYNKLVYTGCTRAKKSLIVLGELESFNFSILSNYSSMRITYLKELLK